MPKNRILTMERKLCGIQLFCILLYVIFNPASSQDPLRYSHAIYPVALEGTLLQPNFNNGIAGKLGLFVATANDGAIHASACGAERSGVEAARINQIARKGHDLNLSAYPNTFSKYVKIEAIPAELPMYGTRGIQVPVLYKNKYAC